jgi:tRNA (adenine-N(1)-)-methyltransferase non-catalytic subunit
MPCCSLVIATGFHPLPLLKQALPLLRPSSPLVIYCEFREPLVECFVFLQHRGLAVKLQLVDPWVREFQVLAERCHPQMSVNMTAGCILTGVVVANRTDQACDEEQKKTEPAAKRVKLDSGDSKE